MAEKASKDAAAKQRIVTHMNGDHHDSIVRYLEYFSKLPSTTAFDGTMVDIDLNSLILSCQGKTYRIPIDPPMSSLAQARERVVELDKEARKALGRSAVTVKRFVPPTGPWAIALGLLIISYVALAQRWWFAKGGLAERLLGPQIAEIAWKTQPWMLPGLALVHVFETAVFSARMKKHSLNPRSRAYWLWIADALFEGQVGIARFNVFVRQQREKQKH